MLHAGPDRWLSSEDRMSYTDNVIEKLTEAMAGGGGLGPSPREVYIYRESLLALVRLAKAEQLLEMQKDFDALTDGLTLARAPGIDRTQASNSLAILRGQRRKD
jgi:hypothetical protein